MTKSELINMEKVYEEDCYPHYVVSYETKPYADINYEIIHDVTTLEKELIQGGRLCNLKYIILHGKTYFSYGYPYTQFLDDACASITADTINTEFSNSGVKVSNEFAVDLVLNVIEVCIEGTLIKAEHYRTENNHIILEIYFNNNLKKSWLLW